MKNMNRVGCSKSMRVSEHVKKLKWTAARECIKSPWINIMYRVFLEHVELTWVQSTSRFTLLCMMLDIHPSCVQFRFTFLWWYRWKYLYFYDISPFAIDINCMSIHVHSILAQRLFSCQYFSYAKFIPFCFSCLFELKSFSSRNSLVLAFSASCFVVSFARCQHVRLLHFNEKERQVAWTSSLS